MAEDKPKKEEKQEKKPDNKEEKKPVKKENEDKKKAAPKKEEKQKFPVIKPGYTVRIYQTIKDGKKERQQYFEGIILAIKGKTPVTRTVTVRKISEGVGVEKIFPLGSPTIAKVEIIKKAKVRKSKLYYLRSYKKKLQEEKVK